MRHLAAIHRLHQHDMPFPFGINVHKGLEVREIKARVAGRVRDRVAQAAGVQSFWSEIPDHKQANIRLEYPRRVISRPVICWRPVAV